MIIFGERLYGKVDMVPGRFHVATSFFHVWFFPLLPFRSYLIDVSGGASRIPFSIKSVLVAWLRAFLVLFILFSLAGTFVSFQEMDQVKENKRAKLRDAIIICGSLAVGGAGLLRASYRFSRASQGRALDLQDLVLKQLNPPLEAGGEEE